MGEAELKAALQQQVAGQIAAAWEQAEAEVAQRRKKLAAEIERLRQDRAGASREEATELRSACLDQAQRQAAAARLAAEAAMGERLLALAVQILPELYRRHQPECWQRLGRELPPGEWQWVQVIPADQERARETWPEARIETAPEILGGMVAEQDDGLIRVDNSLGQRLARAWPILLPRLMADLRKKMAPDGTAESNCSQ